MQSYTKIKTAIFNYFFFITVCALNTEADTQSPSSDVTMTVIQPFVTSTTALISIPIVKGSTPNTTCIDLHSIGSNEHNKILFDASLSQLSLISLHPNQSYVVSLCSPNNHSITFQTRSDMTFNESLQLEEEYVASHWTWFVFSLSCDTSCRVKLVMIVQQLGASNIVVNDFSFIYTNDTIMYWSSVDDENSASEWWHYLNVALNGTTLTLYFSNLQSNTKYRFYFDLYVDNRTFHYETVSQTKLNDRTMFNCTHECFDDKYNYNGLYSKTKSGYECQRWDTDTPHRRRWLIKRMVNELSNNWNHNYCRNPEVDGNIYPWCYTMNKNKRWDYCNVRKCNMNDTNCSQWFLSQISIDAFNLTRSSDSNQFEHSYLVVLLNTTVNKQCRMFAVDVQNEERFEIHLNSVTEHFQHCIADSIISSYSDGSGQRRVTLSNNESGLYQIFLFSFDSSWTAMYSGVFTQLLLIFHGDQVNVRNLFLEVEKREYVNITMSPPLQLQSSTGFIVEKGRQHLNITKSPPPQPSLGFIGFVSLLVVPIIGIVIFFIRRRQRRQSKVSCQENLVVRQSELENPYVLELGTENKDINAF